MRRGTLDVALIGLPSKTDGLVVERLAEDPMVAALPAGHRFASRRILSVAELADDPLFWFSRDLNPAYYDSCESVFATLGFTPVRIAEPADHHVLLSLIAAGQGVALVPRSLRAVARRGVVYKVIRESNALRIGLGVAYREGPVSQPVEAFLAVVRATLRAAP